MTNQSDRLQAALDATGTSDKTYNEATLTLFNGGSSENYNEALKNWLESELNTTYNTLNGAMHAYAAYFGAYNWDSLGTSAFWRPTALFQGSEDGAWYDPNDLTSMTTGRPFAAFTVAPVVAPAADDTVAFIADKAQMGGKSFDDYVNEATSILDGVEGAEFTVGSGASASWDTATNTFTITNVDNANYAIMSWTIPAASGWHVLEGTVTVNTDTTTLYEQFMSGGNVTVTPSATKQRWYLEEATSTTTFRLQMSGDAGGTVTITDMRLVKIPGNHAVVTSDAARPVLRSASSKYYLEFDGTDDFFNSNYAPGTPTDFGVFVAAKQDSVDQEAVVGALISTTERVYIGGNTKLGGGWDDLNWATIQGSTDLGTTAPFVGGLSVTGSTGVTLYKDGVLEDTETSTGAPALGSEALYIGAINDGSDPPTNFWGGPIYGVTIVDRELTATERGSLEAFLAARSGVTL